MTNLVNPITHVRIATRESALAMWQAHYVRDRLLTIYPELVVELLPMRTQGDKILDTPLAKIGGKGLFIKELEIAMQEDRADIAVHSMKDVPMAFPDGFGLYAICPRENPLDAFVSANYAALDDLPRGAVVGTSSLRRQCQLRQHRPDLEIRDLRGNVNTRLAKLDDGQYDAIILAAAGLIRLDMASRIRQLLPVTLSLPAVGQGAVGIECRSDNLALQALLAPLSDADTWDCVMAERAMNARLQGGCQVPIGGHAVLQDGYLHLTGMVGSLDGSKQCRAAARAPRQDAHKLGEQVADALLAQGAGELLAAL